MLGGLVERSITADWLVDDFALIVAVPGLLRVLRCDSGPEFASQARADWAEHRIGIAYIPPGRPWRYGCVESFNSRIRDECLNLTSFYSLAYARVVIGDFKHDYDHRRRHSAPGYLTPASNDQESAHRQPWRLPEQLDRTTGSYQGASGLRLGKERGDSDCVDDARRRDAKARCRAPPQRKRLHGTRRDAISTTPSEAIITPPAARMRSRRRGERASQSLAPDAARA